MVSVRSQKANHKQATLSPPARVRGCGVFSVCSGKHVGTTTPSSTTPTRHQKRNDNKNDNKKRKLISKHTSNFDRAFPVPVPRSSLSVIPPPLPSPLATHLLSAPPSPLSNLYIQATHRGKKRGKGHLKPRPKEGRPAATQQK